MSVRVYDLVETYLKGDVRFSRNRFFDAHQDEEFSRAMRIAKHLQTVIGELSVASPPEVERDGDDMVLRYQVPEPRGPYTREARFSPDEWRVLQRHVDGL